VGLRWLQMIFWQFASRQIDRLTNELAFFSPPDVHILVALAIIGLVLMQHGKGADMGAAFGSGASGSLFGATGSANFLSRTTGVLAAVFFATSLTLAYIGSNKPKTTGSVMQERYNLSLFRSLLRRVLKRRQSPADAGSRAKDIPK
jgi:preprotein translocase subunit SecG